MALMPGVRLVRPRSFTRGRAGGEARLIIIHYTAGSENATSAEGGVSYDARRTDGTSAHFYTDRDSIIQCVDTNDRAHTARWNGNRDGINIEQCGTVQTRAQWLDEASRPTIQNTARVAAWAMRTHGIPLARLVGRQVRTGKGLCGHRDVTVGFPEDGGTHMDPDGHRPGSFPWDVLFTDIGKILAPKSAMAAPSMTIKGPGPLGEWPISHQTYDARKVPAKLCMTLCLGTGGNQNLAALTQGLWVDYFVMMFRRWSPALWHQAAKNGTKVMESHEIDRPFLDAVQNMASQTLGNTLIWKGVISEQIWDIYQPTQWGSVT